MARRPSAGICGCLRCRRGGTGFFPAPTFKHTLRTNGPATLLYIRHRQEQSNAMIFDLNLWGIIAMPIGLSIGFGPVLIAWVLHERADSAGKNPKDRP